jgi:hypothetical protein
MGQIRADQEPRRADRDRSPPSGEQWTVNDSLIVNERFDAITAWHGAGV